MNNNSLYLQPTSVSDSIKMATDHNGQFRFIAGGTDVLVNKFQANENSDCLIDISRIEELKKTKIENGFLHLGSLITLAEISTIPEIRSSFPTLIEAAHAAATPVLRKTATIGGNILCENRCSFYNQSEWWRKAVGYCLKCDGDTCIATGGRKKCFSRFVSDTAPVFIAYNAELEIENETGVSHMALEEIYTGNGIQPYKLSNTSLIKTIMLPLQKKYKAAFMKLRPRASMDFTSLTTAVSISESDRIRIVIGGVDPMPVLVSGDLANKDELIRMAVKKPRIIDNDVYSRSYRKEMIRIFLKKCFDKIENSTGTLVS